MRVVDRGRRRGTLVLCAVCALYGYYLLWLFASPWLPDPVSARFFPPKEVAVRIAASAVSLIVAASLLFFGAVLLVHALCPRAAPYPHFHPTTQQLKPL